MKRLINKSFIYLLIVLFSFLFSSNVFAEDDITENITISWSITDATIPAVKSGYKWDPEVFAYVLEDYEEPILKYDESTPASVNIVITNNTSKDVNYLIAYEEAQGVEIEEITEDDKAGDIFAKTEDTTFTASFNSQINVTYISDSLLDEELTNFKIGTYTVTVQYKEEEELVLDKYLYTFEKAENDFWNIYKLENEQKLYLNFDQQGSKNLHSLDNKQTVIKDFCDEFSFTQGGYSLFFELLASELCTCGETDPHFDRWPTSNPTEEMVSTHFRLYEKEDDHYIRVSEIESGHSYLIVANHRSNGVIIENYCFVLNPLLNANNFIEQSFKYNIDESNLLRNISGQ